MNTEIDLYSPPDSTCWSDELFRRFVQLEPFCWSLLCASLLMTMHVRLSILLPTLMLIGIATFGLVRSNASLNRQSSLWFTITFLAQGAAILFTFGLIVALALAMGPAVSLTRASITLVSAKLILLPALAVTSFGLALRMIASGVCEIIDRLQHRSFFTR